MNPAFSVIFFTTASGAGYGLLIVSGALSLIGQLPNDPIFSLALMGIALAFVSAGLLASTFHLGHPERAWRALSQWRSSWLSREGIMAVVSYVPALGFAGSWMLPEIVPGPRLGWAAAMIASSLTTLYTTAMIYRSLKPIPQWHQRWVIPNYLLLGPMTGAALLTAMLTTASGASLIPAITSVTLTCAAWAAKTTYWKEIGGLAAPDAGTALGLPGRRVRSVEWPHTERNYLLKEMGFRVGRKHADTLRRLSIALAFAAPLALTVLAAFAPNAIAIIATWTAFLAASCGVVIERWLFFAEAQHAVMRYYDGSGV